MKHLLLFLALLFVGQASQAQQLDTAGWCPAGAVWVYRSFSPTSVKYFKFTYQKDTVVLNQNVKKILVSEVEYYNTNPILGRTEDTVGVEYEYISNDSLYFYDPVNNEFLLKFDFSANIGDSIISSNPRSTCIGNGAFPDEDTLYVDDILLDTIHGLIFDRYELSTGNYDHFRFAPVLKNIGSEFAFHPEIPRAVCPSSNATYGSMYEGISFYQDSIRGKLVFSTGISDSLSQSIISSIQSIDQESSNYDKPNLVSLYPNPTQDWIWLDMEFTEPLSATIYSISGQVIKSFQLSQDGFSTKELPNGMYMLHLQNRENKSFYAKFVKS